MDRLIPAEPFELSKEAAAYVDAINSEWATAQARRKQHDAEATRLDAIDPLSFTAADAKAKRRHREEAVEILQTEIPLLKRLTEWPAIRTRERSAAFDRINATRDRAADVIRKKLAGIGFDPSTCAKSVAKTPNDLHEAEGTATNAIEAVIYVHPTVAPFGAQMQHLGFLRHDQMTEADQNTKTQIARKETELRAAIAAL